MLSMLSRNNLRKGKLASLTIALIFLFIISFVAQPVAANVDTSPLVSTKWLADHLKDKDIRIIHIGSMVPESQKNFGAKHIPGSVFVGIGDLMGAIGNGSTPPDKAAFEALMGRLGVSNDSHVVIAGSGGGNPFTTGAFWLMKYQGHHDVSYLDGGIKKWIAENRATTGEATNVMPSKYTASPDSSIIAYADDVLAAIKNNKIVIIDVRGEDEYTGQNNAVKNQRTGHIPSAINMNFYTSNLNPDGTFKSVAELKSLYESKGVTPDKEIITYCQGGVRAANTHLVLKYLLGYKNVKNYIGSWGEWGNRLDPAKYPVEK
jgi:thiosulfate/3-mercaptopyruvate sulfurtransferase